MENISNRGSGNRGKKDVRGVKDGRREETGGSNVELEGIETDQGWGEGKIKNKKKKH